MHPTVPMSRKDLGNTSDIEPTDVEDYDDNDDIFLSMASCGTSPLNGGNDDEEDNDNDNDNVVYEVVSEGSDIALEKPGESTEAELSMHSSSYYSTLLTFYSQNALQRNRLHQSMSSSETPLILNMLTAVMSMCLNVWPPTARGSMAEMFVASLIQVMPSQQAVCIGTRRCVGVRKQSVLLIILKTWMVHTPFWQSLG